jgi:fumarate hydratase, class II
MNDYRVEHDSFGSVQIPQNRLWGPQTQRSIQNFNIGVTEKMPRQVIHALGLAKLAAVQVNMNEGKIPKDIGEAIAQASKEVMRGDHDEEFPLVVW